MYYPDRRGFLKLAEKGKMVPVMREILADMETPVSAFRKIADDSPYAFLLESVEGGEILGRYSFLGVNPSLIFTSRGERVRIVAGGQGRELKTEDPLQELEKEMVSYNPVELGGFPRFSGGAVGYLSYDIVRFWEKLPEENPDDLNLPEAVFLLSETLVVFDHLEHKIKVVTNTRIGNNPERNYQEACGKLDEVVSKIRTTTLSHFNSPPSQTPRRIESNFTKENFMSKVERAKEYIRKGDIFQVVLSQRFSVKIGTKSLDIYRALRSLNPSPYMYYLKLGDFEIVGSSPEILVRKEGDKVILRPIAGTRKRGSNTGEDEGLMKELLSDPKERAEHIMLVDLGRNDVGRVSQYGSVRVTELMTVEKYSHVMHIVSNVEGNIKPELDQFDVLRACFPAGTVTGAPKIRAMEIIEELEPTRRGPYAGAVGYFSFSGNLDSCITIRTIIIKDGVAYIQAGAGIVADSHPEREYYETINKARALIKAIELAEEGLG